MNPGSKTCCWVFNWRLNFSSRVWVCVFTFWMLIHRVWGRKKMNWLQVCYQLSEEAWCGRGAVLNGTKVGEFSNDSIMTLHISRRSSHRTLALNRSRSFPPVCSIVTLVFCGMWRIQSLELGVLGATGCVLHLYALLDNVRHPAAHLICLCSPAQTLCTGLPVPPRARHRHTHTQIRKN